MSTSKNKPTNVITAAIKKPRIIFEKFMDQWQNGDFDEKAIGPLLMQSNQTIQALLSNPATSALRRNAEDVNTSVTGRQYLIRLFGLADDLDSTYSREADQIKQVLTIAENAMMRHLVRSANDSFSSAAEYTLRLTHATSSTFLPHSLLQRKNDCLFSIDEFSGELKAAGATTILNTPLDKDEVFEMYKSLPPSVKTLFFSRSTLDGSPATDTPMALVRDLLIFADEDKWQRLCESCALPAKATFNKYLNTFVNNFVLFERSQHKLNLGMRDVQADTDKDIIRSSHKAQAIAQFCRPRKWIAKDKEPESSS